MMSISSHKGSATILTMLIAAVIITVGLGFNWLVKEHLKASEGLRNKAEAILKARSAYDTILYLLLNGRVTEREVITTLGDEISNLKTLPLDGQKVSLSDDLYIQAQDSNGMLSFVNMNLAVFERLIKKVGGVDNTSGIIDSYLDWIDEDNFVRINGAEEAYYRGQGLPYGPRNYPIQYKEEGEWINGIDKKLYAKIEPYLTMLPTTGFNPNTASDEVLMAYLNIDEGSLRNLRDYMSKKSIASDMELFTITGRRITSGEEGGYFFPSPFIEITVSAGRPRSIYTIKTGLDTRQNVRSPYGILYWKEE
ncbi:MAG: general secretion pathway protein GspK [Deltaproteobacteria bacterium]|nr:general secretion pathway protein GspK [Deltaproteobacteria bacterium]